MPIRNRFAEMLPEIAGWRQHLHAHPELMYDTVETAAFVAARLRDFGCDEVVEGIGRTGVVGLIRGKAPGRRVGGRGTTSIDMVRILPWPAWPFLDPRQSAGESMTCSVPHC